MFNQSSWDMIRLTPSRRPQNVKKIMDGDMETRIIRTQDFLLSKTICVTGFLLLTAASVIFPIFLQFNSLIDPIFE